LTSKKQELLKVSSSKFKRRLYQCFCVGFVSFGLLGVEPVTGAQPEKAPVSRLIALDLSALPSISVTPKFKV